MVDTIVRGNLMTEKGYTPYCGGAACGFRWPRLTWDGEQFICRCGYRTEFPEDFIKAYKEKWGLDKRTPETEVVFEPLKRGDQVTRWPECTGCKGRGWFLIDPFKTGGGNGAGGIENLRQCQRCKKAHEYYAEHGEIPSKEIAETFIP